MRRLSIICTSFIIVSLMFAGQSYANIGPKTVWKSDGVPVSAISNITQVNPRIVADGYGGAIICWQDYRYTDLDIYAQRLDEHGKVHAGWTNTTYLPWKDYGV
jgi:hypothetical protein